MKRFKQWSGLSREETGEISRSQYSLVSNTDLTSEAIQLWLGLPEEVKYDPALAPFRQYYEKKNGKTESIALKSNGSAHKVQRLPLVKSAPHLQPVTEDSQSDIKQGSDTLIDEEKLTECSTKSKSTLITRASYLVKIGVMVAVWLYFTTMFLLYSEKHRVERKSFVGPEATKYFTINSTQEWLDIKLDLAGPFLSSQSEEKRNSDGLTPSSTVNVWLERRISPGNGSTNTSAGYIEKSKVWTIHLLNSTELDFNIGEKRTSTLKFESGGDLRSSGRIYSVCLNTTSAVAVPFSMSYTLDPCDETVCVMYAVALLCGLYALIIFEVINRTLAAILIATLALAVLAYVGERPSLQEIVSWLDAETLVLLFSMMLLVALMAETGLFDFLAVFTFEITKGRLWPLINLLCLITALLSTFLDNVTTVLLMSPVTIRLCEVMDLNPVPILMSMVIYSNIGGTATPVGDPPNVIIASNKEVIAAGVNFTNFTLHMAFAIFLVYVQTYLQLRYIYSDTNKLRLNVPRDIQERRQQIAIWRRAAESLPHLSKDEHVVRQRLERKVRKLHAELDELVRRSSKRACPEDTYESTLAELKQKYKIRDKLLLAKTSIAIAFVVVVFFLHSIPEFSRLSLGWTAFLGALLLLLLADREDLEPVLHRVEWSTLMFFGALFILMEALSKLGLISYIGGMTESLILKVDEEARLAVAILLMLWISGLTSAFVDNIPLTTMMVKVVTSLGSNPNLGLPMTPLVWALSLGACLGGNGTLIGASANVVCAGVAEQHGYRFTFVQFFKVGFPIMTGHLIISSFYLYICHCVFAWH